MNFYWTQQNTNFTQSRGNQYKTFVETNNELPTMLLKLYKYIITFSYTVDSCFSNYTSQIKVNKYNYYKPISATLIIWHNEQKT